MPAFPVIARASLIAPVVASEPLVAHCNMQPLGKCASKRSAASNSMSVARPNVVPLHNCRRTASSTSGLQWPRITPPKPITMSSSRSPLLKIHAPSPCVAVRLNDGQATAHLEYVLALYGSGFIDGAL